MLILFILSPFVSITLLLSIFLCLSLNLLISCSRGSNLPFNPSVDFYTLITSFVWLWRCILIWVSSCISPCSVSASFAGSSSSSLLSDEVTKTQPLYLFSFSQSKPLSRWSHQSWEFKCCRYADISQSCTCSSAVSFKLPTCWLWDISTWKF